ncbi:MAG: hypothetical protein JWQ01_4569 [Massilia sp.]|nr:hypothetical protein [Massilia sp.]
METGILVNHVAGIPLLEGPKYTALRQLWKDGDVSLERFADWFRRQSFAFDACDLTLGPSELLRRSFDTAMMIGAQSVPIGIATVMHLYMLGAMATFPTRDRESLFKRETIFGLIRDHQWLVANSGSDMQVRSDNASNASMVAERVADGICFSGHKTFVSLATVADLLVFTATEKGTGSLLSMFALLRGIDGIRFENAPFPAFLSETGTRSVVMERLVLPLENMISGGRTVAFEHAHAFQRMWFSALIPAVYLGAAVAALSEARNFACANQTSPGNRLADLDGVAMEFGRLTLTLSSAFIGFETVCQAITRACDAPDGAVTTAAADLASIFKYNSMRAICEVAPALRRFVGTRSMMPHSSLLRFSQESMFGPLHPELESLLERRLGSNYLHAAKDTPCEL